MEITALSIQMGDASVHDIKPEGPVVSVLSVQTGALSGNRQTAGERGEISSVSLSGAGYDDIEMPGALPRDAIVRRRIRRWSR